MFPNIERAFDSVPHDVIFSYLSHLGVTGNMLRFIVDFFSNRTYFVRSAAITSSMHRLARGVPEGSCLSPVFFNIVLATVQLCLSSCKTSLSCGIIIYADDTCL